MKNNIKKMLVSCALATTMLFSYAAAGCLGGKPDSGNTPVTSSSTANKNSSSKKPSTSSSSATKRYKVTFEFGDGSRATTKNVKAGESLAKGETPAGRDGYSFVGWATSADASASDVISFPYKPTGDVTLYAIWEKASYTVTFNKNYEGSTADTVKVEFEGMVEAPETDPTRDGYVFQAWMNKAEEGEAVTFPYQVKGDVTFYASWISEQTKTYTVSFDYNYSDAPAQALKSLTVVDGGAVTSRNVQNNLTRDGYNFIGWNTDKNATTKMSFPYKPTDDTVLYAIWQKKVYTVTYKYNTPDATSDFAKFANLDYGVDLPQAPGTPTRAGHTFVGWYTTSVGGELANLNQKVTSAVNLYAHWKADAVTTDTFHAEFTEFDPLEEFPGYSNSVNGAGVVVPDTGYSGIIFGANDYKTNVNKPTVQGHFITYIYKKGATVTFKIYASEATTVTLSANLAKEFVSADVLVAPTGDYGWQVKVNDQEHKYEPFTMSGAIIANNATAFAMYSLGTINLKAGENVIQFITNNENTIIGGTTKAFAPMMDCIKLTGGSASLSYHPIYDNLWYTALN